MTILCQKRGCERAATHAIQIGVGTILDPDDAPPRCKALMGVVVCEPCLDEEEASKWFEGDCDLRPLFRVSMSGLAAPDFDRAVVVGISLESAEYRELVGHGISARLS